MTALAADRMFRNRSADSGRLFAALLAASTSVWAGGLISSNSAGYAKPSDTTPGDIVLGWCPAAVANSGSAGAASTTVQTGVIKLNNDGTHPVAQAGVGRPCYVKDDNTVQSAAGTSAVIAGVVDSIDADGGIWVVVGDEVSNLSDGASGATYSDTVLTTSPGPTLPEPIGSDVTYVVETTGTVAGVLPNGAFPGQTVAIMQAVAATTPVGTITGTYQNQAKAAKTTLALGTAVGLIFVGTWTGSAWIQIQTLGGTGSSLS